MTTPQAEPAKTRVEEIRGRLEAATPGQWKSEDDPLQGAWSVRRDGFYVCQTRTETGIGGTSDIGKPDADFIANAPADISWLLAEVERLQSAFDDYGDHTMSCACRRKLSDPCDCGYINAIS